MQTILGLLEDEALWPIHDRRRDLLTAMGGQSGRVFMEYLRRVPGEDDLLVAEVLVVERGLIRESRVFHG